MNDTLYHALQTSLARYESFLADDPGTDAKAFTAHHNAAKAAVTHMLALCKLQAMHQKEDRTQTDNDLEQLLRRARDVLTRPDLIAAES